MPEVFIEHRGVSLTSLQRSQNQGSSLVGDLNPTRTDIRPVDSLTWLWEDSLIQYQVWTAHLDLARSVVGSRFMGVENCALAWGIYII